LDGYGIGKISLHPAIWAQTGGTGNGNGSGNGSGSGGSGGGTNTGTGGGSDSGTYDIAGDANNASGLLWEDYSYNCVVSEKIVITSSCESYYVGAVFYCTTTDAVTLIGKITECGAAFSRTVHESGIKKYCFDGWSFCISNTNCH
jgi:hypothetical protein